MKNTKGIDKILNDCLERLLISGETLEQCLSSYPPEQADELKPLLETALKARNALNIEPRPEFKATARYQFGTAVQRMRPRKMFSPLGWQPRWATVLASILVVLLVGGGTVAAASNSMPDEPLYPIKLASEQAWLTFTPSNISKAEIYARLTERRVNEIAQMVDRDKPEQVEKVTERLNTQITSIAVLAKAEVSEDSAAVTSSPAPELAPTPAPTPMPLSPSVKAGGNSGPYPRDERLDRLRVIIARNATNHPEALRAMLKTAPESAKPALRRALAIAEARYQQAVEAVADEYRDR